MQEITDFITMCHVDLFMVLRIIFSLIIIEALLSVDNAAVLATMVRELPQEQQAKALRYGLIGAYGFRGLAMLFAATLIQFAWLKYAGGLYLIYLAAKHFYGKYITPNDTSDDVVIETKGRFFDFLKGYISTFWATICLVEVMDFTFSIDNIFAAVAFTKNLVLLCLGVFIGILAMRFVAQGFIKLMDRFHFLEVCAYLVIGLLGIKLCLGLPTMFFDLPTYKHFIEGEALDAIVSASTLAIFFLPVLTSWAFNYPRQNKV